jgi:hypothetical protein
VKINLTYDFGSSQPDEWKTRRFAARGAPTHFVPPSGYPTATLAAAKGRLMRCTVPGSTPNCLAMTRTPGRPIVAKQRTKYKA